MRSKGNEHSIVLEKKEYFKRVFKVVRLLVDEDERLRGENRKLKGLLREGLDLVNRIGRQL
jgi:hypothetical protein